MLRCWAPHREPTGRLEFSREADSQWVVAAGVEDQDKLRVGMNQVVDELP